MAMTLKRVRGVIVGAGLLAATVGLTACSGGDGVELNGKIFDAIGLSGDPFAKKVEPKTQARAPLVLPPSAEKLPEPGTAGPGPGLATSSITTGSIGGPSWPVDAQSKKVADAEAEKRAKQQACDDWKKKAANDGSAPQCGGSIFSIIGDSIFGTSE